MFFNTLGIIWQNLTAPNRKLPNMSWEDGQEILHIPYAAESESQYLDLYLPNTAGKKPLLVLVHGGGFLFGDSQSKQAQWMYRYFRRQGYVCASVNYRLAQEAAWPAAISDVKAALRFLYANAARYGIDETRIAIWGESAGGYLAAMAAVTDAHSFNDVPALGEGNPPGSPRVKVLIDFYGLSELGSKSADFRQEGVPNWIVRPANSWLNPPELKASGFRQLDDFFIRKPYSTLSAAEAARYCPLNYVRKMDLSGLKVILVHGEADITVPVLQTRRLEAAFVERLGTENVFSIYPHSCKHADDRLYDDGSLATVKEKLDFFINSTT